MEKNLKDISSMETVLNILKDIKWVEAEMYAKALQLLVPLKQIPEDQQIDKNANRKL